MRSEAAEHDARIRAFRELYLREFAFVWATARRFGVQPALVEDAVQDVFLTAYRRLDQVRFEVSERAWLHGVTRKVAARYRRTAARLSRRLAALAAAPRGPAEAPHERVAAAQQLGRLLERLGGKTRAAFEMSELHGMSGPEIAGELGIPVSTVYSRVRLAREQLERELGGPALERELTAARERDAPPPAVAQRSWAALLPGLVPGHAGVGVGLVVSARAAVMTTLVLAAGVAGVVWPRGQVSGGPREVVAAPIVAERAAGGAARGTGELVEPAGDAAASRSSAAARAAPGPAGERQAGAGPVRGGDRPAARERAGEASESAEPDLLAAEVAARERAGEASGAADPDLLAAEVAVLDRARAALARGDVGRAGAELAEHARRFPGGAFADLRGATEVELLCRQGRPREAVARADALALAHPGSAVARRFANFSCPE